jgi:hypothetical protein
MIYGDEEDDDEANLVNHEDFEGEEDDGGVLHN